VDGSKYLVKICQILKNVLFIMSYQSTDVNEKKDCSIYYVKNGGREKRL
jgi:ribosomal protein S8